MKVDSPEIASSFRLRSHAALDELQSITATLSRSPADKLELNIVESTPQRKDLMVISYTLK